MELLLKRIAKKQNYTVGDLYIDGKWFSNTLEDKDRGLTQNMTEEEISKIKVYGSTAIPTGKYKIDMNTVSPKFKNRPWAKQWNGKLPRLKSVPGYEGVLIHVGNTQKDTLGCILVGENKIKGQVINSTTTFNKLMKLLTKEEDITITIQ